MYSLNHLRIELCCFVAAEKADFPAEPVPTVKHRLTHLLKGQFTQKKSFFKFNDHASLIFRNKTSTALSYKYAG